MFFSFFSSFSEFNGFWCIWSNRSCFGKYLHSSQTSNKIVTGCDCSVLWETNKFVTHSENRNCSSVNQIILMTLSNSLAFSCQTWNCINKSTPSHPVKSIFLI